MHPFALKAKELKDRGYPQSPIMFDNIYLVKSNQYAKFLGKDITEEFYLVPNPVSIMRMMIKYDYVIEHKYIGEEQDKESWAIKHKDQIFLSDALWVSLSNFWLFYEGKK